VNDSQARSRPWYYTHLTADPNNPEVVWAMDAMLWRSVDGGRTFEEYPGTHGDYHQLWIDPNDSQRMINANDGGGAVSFTGGRSWSPIFNQRTAQFYRIAVDDNYPFGIYGSQQDNLAIRVPSKTGKACIS